MFSVHVYIYICDLCSESLMKLRKSLLPCVSLCPSSLGWYLIMSAPGFFWGSCRIFCCFTFPCCLSVLYEKTGLRPRLKNKTSTGWMRDCRWDAKVYAKSRRAILKIRTGCKVSAGLFD